MWTGKCGLDNTGVEKPGAIINQKPLRLQLINCNIFTKFYYTKNMYKITKTQIQKGDGYQEEICQLDLN